MRHAFPFLLLTALVTIGLSAVSGCGDGNDNGSAPTPTPTTTPSPATEPTPVGVDLSANLTGLRFAREGRLCFFPPVDALSTADIERRDDGQFTARLVVLQEAPAEDPTCFPTQGRCVKQIVLPERVLTAGEVAALKDASRSVVVLNFPADPCHLTAVAQCLVNDFTWTRAVRDVTSPDRVLFSASDYACDVPRLASGESEKLVAVLEGLR